MLTLVFEVPVDVIGPNAREHRLETARRVKQERQAALLTAKAFYVRPMRAEEIAKVTMTRLGPRRMDDDNLAAAMKAVRDGIADALGVDDGDPRIMWVPRQLTARSRRGVKVEIHYDEKLKGEL